MHLFPQINPVQRRHGNEDMPGIDKGGEVFDEQRAEQRGDMQTVGVGIREDADLVIAQLFEVGAARVSTNRHGNIVHFLRAIDIVGFDFPRI